MSARRGAVLSLLATGLVAGIPSAQAGEIPGSARTLTDLGAGSLSARGTAAVASVFVPVPPGYAVAGGDARLRIAHSPLLLPDRSTVTLAVAGEPRTSARLTRDGASGSTVVARIPKLARDAAGFLLEARFTMRLTRDACEDPRNAALWARVDRRSTVTLDLVPAGRTVDRALPLLAPATARAATDVVLQGATDAVSLATAGRLAAALGRADARLPADPLTSVTRQRDPARPAIVVARDGRVPSAFDADAPPAGTGLVAVTADGAPQVLVAGADARGLDRAAGALTGRPLAPVTTRTVSVTGPVAQQSPQALPWRRGAASFAQLGIGSRQALGPGLSTIDLAVDRPPQWALTGEPFVELAVDAGAGLRTSSSSLTLTVGGEPAGSRRLMPGRGPRTLRFAIPAGLLDRALDGRTLRRIPLGLTFDLDVAQQGCEPLDVDAARAVVGSTSKVVLPHEDRDARDLSRFPAPVARPGREVDIVVGNRPTAAELDAGVQLAAAVGRWADPRAPLPRLVQARDADVGGRNLIVVGDADGDLERTVRLPGATAAGAGEGLIGVVKSPFADDRQVLVVRGDGRGLRLAARTLARADGVSTLAGQVMRVTPASRASGVTAGDDLAGPPAVLAPVIEDRTWWEDRPAWAIPAAVTLLLFLGLGGAIVRRRWLR